MTLSDEEVRVLGKVLASIWNLIGAEEWDLSEPDEWILWEIIKRWPKEKGP